MATTKKAVKFYAEAAVEAHLDTIPAQLRTNWINQTLLAAIERDKNDSQSELGQLRLWLENKSKPSPLEEALAAMLSDFAFTRVNK